MIPRPRKRRTPKTIARLIEPGAYYSYNEASFILGIGVLTIRRAIESGNLKSFKVGRVVRFTGADLLDWIDRGGRTGWDKPVGTWVKKSDGNAPEAA